MQDYEWNTLKTYVHYCFPSPANNSGAMGTWMIRVSNTSTKSPYKLITWNGVWNLVTVKKTDNFGASTTTVGCDSLNYFYAIGDLMHASGPSIYPINSWVGGFWKSDFFGLRYIWTTTPILTFTYSFNAI